MIVEMRQYTLEAGKVPAFLQRYGEQGVGIQSEILGGLEGYFSTDVGSVNQVVHLWSYESFEERIQRRKQLAANDEWQNYVSGVRPWMREQRSSILVPAPFSPMPSANRG